MLTTSDIYLAAALMSLGAKLDHVNREDPRHMEFGMDLEPQPLKFESTVLNDAINPAVASGTVVALAPKIDLIEYEKKWMNGELMVNAVRFADAIKRMKSVVHSR